MAEEVDASSAMDHGLATGRKAKNLRTGNFNRRKTARMSSQDWHCPLRSSETKLSYLQDGSLRKSKRQAPPGDVGPTKSKLIFSLGSFEMMFRSVCWYRAALVVKTAWLGNDCCQRGKYLAHFIFSSKFSMLKMRSTAASGIAFQF